MNRIIAIADRAACASLKLLVALNVLFFLSFLAILLFAAGRANAEIPARTGADMQGPGVKAGKAGGKLSFLSDPEGMAEIFAKPVTPSPPWGFKPHLLES